MNPYNPIETYVVGVLLMAARKDASHVRIAPTPEGIAEIEFYFDRWVAEDREIEHAGVIEVLCKQMGLPPPLRGKTHTGRVALQEADDTVLCYLVAMTHGDSGISVLVERVDEKAFGQREAPNPPPVAQA